MAHVNKDEAAAAEASRLPLSERMAHVHISRISELPRIELYLDQVLAIVAGELAPVMLPGEVAITGSMVNNYVKQKVVPAPRALHPPPRGVAAVCHGHEARLLHRADRQHDGYD